MRALSLTDGLELSAWEWVAIGDTREDPVFEVNDVGTSEEDVLAEVIADV